MTNNAIAQEALLHIALWEPEIPPNTGNIARTCAATGIPLHLIGRLGFHLEDRYLKRAGCDYWGDVEMHQHLDLAHFEQAMALPTGEPRRIWCLSAHAQKSYTKVEYQKGDVLLFGSESRGLPAEVLDRHYERMITIPMPTGKVRSINLATAAGIVLCEALRQLQNW